MKICMVTSFFGPFSFGGDAVYVERLTEALLHRGHEMHVAYSPGAYQAARKQSAQRPYRPPNNLSLHLFNRGLAGMLDTLWIQQTGRSTHLKRRFDRFFGEHDFDVIHLHNISLLGAASLIRVAAGQRATTLVTAHDFWWHCPQSLLWQYGRRICATPRCHRCSLCRLVPPQFWRNGSFIETLNEADGLLFPSDATAENYRSKGLRHSNTMVLPGLIPGSWLKKEGDQHAATSPPSRQKPYLAAAGRLVPEKGFQTVIPLMKKIPGLDLLIAGDGPFRKELQKKAESTGNVHFLGQLSSSRLRRLFLNARAVVVPSLFPETFCLVAAETIALGIPLVARRVGALPELAEKVASCSLYETEDELLSQLLELESTESEHSAESLVEKRSLPKTWFEAGHVDSYLSFIESLRTTGTGTHSP